MVKKIIGRIFGFEKEIIQLKSHIKELGFDSTFNMLTRNAFLEHCRHLPRNSYTIAFLDFDRMHELNTRFGYEEVNKRIRKTFEIPFRASDIRARWYSGDEIVLLLDSNIRGAKNVIEDLEISANIEDLSFTWAIDTWQKDVKELPDFVNKLAESVSAKKKHNQPQKVSA